MASFDYQAFIEEVLGEGIWLGTRDGLVRLLGDREGVVGIRMVEEWKGDSWVEVLENVESRLVGKCYQVVGGVQVVEKWVEVEGGGFVRETVEPKTISYD